MEKRGRLILGLVTVLAISAAMVVTLDIRGQPCGCADKMRNFQKAVGGLGLGAIAAPMWQFINYDFRVQSADDSVTWPVPGGYSYGPDRTATVTYFEESAGDQWIVRKP